jgi:hypothetical protein
MKKIVAIALFLAGIWCLPIPAAREENVLPESVLKILFKAEQFELLSLLPEPEKTKPNDHFHGYTVLGKTAIKNDMARKKLIESFSKGMEGAINPAKCFEPRHGIRATQDGKTVDLVICFACSQFYVHDASGKSTKYLVNATPQSGFDKMLKEAGIQTVK